MGWVERRGKKFRLSFRYGGVLYRHSLGVESQKEADESLALVERNLRLLEQGVLDLPRGADLPLFLLSGGKLTAKPEVHAVLTLGRLVELYLGAHVGAREANTIYTARIHANHLKRTLGEDFSIQTLTASDLQSHVERRKKMKGRGGRPLATYTIKKEITGLSGIWSWAVRMGHLTGPYPNEGLVYPKSADKPPFQTRAEIEAQLARGGLTDAEKAELWGCLFLTLPEVAELLEFVKANARHDWIYPMVCFAAHTGARRSEILRSRIADFDFAAKSVLIREQKRVKGRRSTRRVPLSGFLAGVMREWFDAHPGGVYAICQPLKVFKSKKRRTDHGPITKDESTHHFNATLAGSKWGVVAGWHCLRHSFASNCAASGVDQRLINAWMGHQTLEMQQRYAHLIPSVSRSALDSVFDG
jgi:integrase